MTRDVEPPPALIEPALCLVCGASWACEHQPPEAPDMQSKSLDELRDLVRPVELEIAIRLAWFWGWTAGDE